MGTAAGLYPELKTPALYRARGIDQTALFVDSLKRLALHTRPAGSLIVQSFDTQPLKDLTRLIPSLPRIFLIDNRDGPRWLTDSGLAEIARSPPDRTRESPAGRTSRDRPCRASRRPHGDALHVHDARLSRRAGRFRERRDASLLDGTGRRRLVHRQPGSLPKVEQVPRSRFHSKPGCDRIGHDFRGGLSEDPVRRPAQRLLPKSRFRRRGAGATRARDYLGAERPDRLLADSRSSTRLRPRTPT